MKYLIILGVIAVIFYLLLFWRLRRYFPLARRIFGITRDIYRMTKPEEGSQPLRRTGSAGSEKLVRCAACGTWIPTGRAISLRSSTYCSTDCLENRTAAPQRERRRKAVTSDE